MSANASVDRNLFRRVPKPLRGWVLPALLVALW